MPNRIEITQEELKKRGLYNDIIDGDPGRNTIKALDQVTGIDKNWPVKQKIVGFIQILCKDYGIDPKGIDGFWGPDTEFAYNQYLYLREHNKLPAPWRPEERAEVNPYNWPKQYTLEFDSFYGQRGQNLIKIQLPYPHKIAWDTSSVINSFSCHVKVHDSMKRVLTKVLNVYGLDEIKRLRLDLWGGCYNERPLRGGTKWSMHSWGIAVDFDPGRNKLEWGRNNAAFSQPEYNRWWEIWEEEGWISLGRQRNFDWMHVQAAKL